MTDLEPPVFRLVLAWNLSGMVEGHMQCTNISSHLEVQNIPLVHGMNEMNTK